MINFGKFWIFIKGQLAHNLRHTASALHTPLTNPHTEASISYQMNLREFRGKFPNLISTELAMGVIVLKKYLLLLCLEIGSLAFGKASKSGK